jgi:hypothetical protein
LEGNPNEAVFVKGFDTYTGALTNAVKILPSESLSLSGLALPELVFTFVTVASALGMAFVVDLQRNHVFEDIGKQLKEREIEGLNLFMDTYQGVEWQLSHPDSKANKLSREL